MRHDNSKFMIQLLQSFTHKQIFFSVWFVIVSIFVLLMVSFYRRNTRRNFRSDGEGPKINVDARRLPGIPQDGGLVIKQTSHPVAHEATTGSVPVKGKTPPHR